MPLPVPRDEWLEAFGLVGVGDRIMQKTRSGRDVCVGIRRSETESPARADFRLSVSHCEVILELVKAAADNEAIVELVRVIEHCMLSWQINEASRTDKFVISVKHLCQESFFPEEICTLLIDFHTVMLGVNEAHQMQRRNSLGFWIRFTVPTIIRKSGQALRKEKIPIGTGTQTLALCKDMVRANDPMFEPVKNVLVKNSYRVSDVQGPAIVDEEDRQAVRRVFQATIRNLQKWPINPTTVFMPLVTVLSRHGCFSPLVTFSDLHKVNQFLTPKVTGHSRSSLLKAENLMIRQICLLTDDDAFFKRMMPCVQVLNKLRGSSRFVRMHLEMLSLTSLFGEVMTFQHSLHFASDPTTSVTYRPMPLPASTFAMSQPPQVWWNAPHGNFQVPHLGTCVPGEVLPVPTKRPPPRTPTTAAPVLHPAADDENATEDDGEVASPPPRKMPRRE